jgi:hypothetical protein
MKVTNLINKKVESGKRRMFFRVQSESEILPAGELLLQINIGPVPLFNCKVQLKEIASNAFATFFADLPATQFKLSGNIVWAWKPLTEAKIMPKMGKCEISTKMEKLV